jgi:hypothetical protein
MFLFWLSFFSARICFPAPGLPHESASWLSCCWGHFHPQITVFSFYSLQSGSPRKEALRQASPALHTGRLIVIRPSGHSPALPTQLGSAGGLSYRLSLNLHAGKGQCPAQIVASEPFDTGIGRCQTFESCSVFSLSSCFTSSNRRRLLKNAGSLQSSLSASRMI